jgi:glycosyltransferase involved in cell wall biosynthesis
MRLISLLSSLVLVNSKRVAAKFLAVVPASKLRRIPYAVNVPQELSGYRDDLKQNGPFSLIIAGRVTPEKGQRTALQAISILLKHHRITQFKLMILGAQPDDAEVRVIQAFIDKESLQAHVEILPFTKEPLQLIRSCHVLLMCSQCEAFGRVTVEAMKLGLVVVGSNTGGTLDIVQHDVNGLLYESGNVEDLAQKLADVISDPIKRTRLSLNATMHAHQTFSEQTHEHALNEALRCIASPPSTREDRLKGKFNPAGTAAADSSTRPSSAVAIEN